MGSKLKALQAQMQQLQQQYQSALTAAQTPSAAEQALTTEALGNQKWLAGGDYRSAPHGVFFSLVDPAAARRQRELQTNVGATGISALGTPNATALGLAKQNMDDENANDTAANYQSEVSNLADKTAGILGSLGSADTNRKMSILSNLGGMYQNSQNQWAQQAFKPGFWQQILPSVLGAAGSAAASFMGGSPHPSTPVSMPYLGTNPFSSGGGFGSIRNRT